MLKQLQTLHYHVKSKINGSKKKPAQSCAELFNLHKELSSGLYWIDPNGLDKKDAIQVYCDKELLATCLITQPEIFTNTEFTKSTGMWLSDINNGFQFNYKADSSQIRYIQFTSSTVQQNLTINLNNDKEDIQSIQK